MGAQSRRFTSLASGSGKATAVVVCAVMLLAGCGGSAGSSTDAGTPVIRGDAPATSSVTVEPPGTPPVPTVVAGDGFVTVTVAAGLTGGTPTSYRVFVQKADNGAELCVVTGASGSCIVTGLTPGSTYRVWARAANAAGWGYNSDFTTVTLPEKSSLTAERPGTPPVPTVVVGDGKVTVTVAAGLTGGTPTYYTVEVLTIVPAYKSLGTCTVTGASGSCDVASLPSAYIKARAYARNSAGTSSSSESATFKVAEAGARMWYAVNFLTGIGAETGSMPTQIASTPTPLRANTFNPPGKDFIGWSIGNVATGYTNGKVVYADKAIYSFDSDVWLVAEWRDQTVPGTPPAPTVVAGTAKVTATVAAGTSGGTPASYTVTAYTANGTAAGTCTVTGASGSCDVTALTAGSTYTVKASAKNTAGTSGESVASSPVTVAVTVPGTPPAPTVVAGTAKVTATVAAGTSGGTPASYTVTAYTANGTAAGTCTVTGASGSCDVTALTGGSTYTVKASAKNTGGTSGESVASSPVTVAATVPGAPGLTSIARKTGTEVWVTFSAPSSNGGEPITEYTVTSKGPGGKNTTHSFPAQAGRVTFVGPLTQSGWYTFTVRAVNSVGTSTPSNATRYFKA